MAHVGSIKERTELVVTLIGDYTFISCYGYRETLNHIYSMKDEEGNLFVWKTGSTFALDKVTETEDIYEPVRKGDTIRIKATIKDHSEYKGTPQTVLTRVKVQEFVKKALTKEEKQAIKREEQIASLQEGDFIYEMPYRQYKKHYDDCETLAGSYDDETRTIGVIIRDGRLKASGVRFQKFSDYMFKTEDGQCRCIYAVSEENAWKRLAKEYDGAAGWFLAKVIPSGSRWF